LETTTLPPNVKQQKQLNVKRMLPPKMLDKLQMEKLLHSHINATQTMTLSKPC